METVHVGWETLRTLGRVSGSDPTPFCSGTALFLKLCLWFLRPDPRTCHPAGPVKQLRSYRDGTCCVTKHLLDDQYGRCFSLLPYRLWAIVDKVVSKLCSWTCTWACEAGRPSTSSFPCWHKLYPVIVFVGRGSHICRQVHHKHNSA